MKQITESNRQGWNARSSLHKGQVDKVVEALKQPEKFRHDAVEQKVWENIGIEGKAVVQLCCNNGKDILKLKAKGAGQCLGVDISDDFIRQANEIAERSKVDCEFLRSDVYEIPEIYFGQFDVVLLTVGTLGWMPDLPLFFDVCKRLLKPKGKIFIYEIHPYIEVFNPDSPFDKPELELSYFREEPYESEDESDYLTGERYESPKTYWFIHRISEVFTSLLSLGFTVTHFDEYKHSVTPELAKFEKCKQNIPLSYSMIAE